MSQLSSDTRLRSLYNKYLYLEDKAYHDKIRFYEHNQQDVYNMRLQDSLWIQSGYLEAVYEVGHYKKYIDISQDFLQRLIFENITYFNGENIYEEILQCRSVAFYQLKSYDESVHVAEQLLNINPERKDTRKILYFAHRSCFQKSLKFIKASSVVLALSAAFVLLFEQIVIASFFPEKVVFYLNITFSIFLPAFVILILSKLLIDALAYRKMRNWYKMAKGRKS